MFARTHGRSVGVGVGREQVDVARSYVGMQLAHRCDIRAAGGGRQTAQRGRDHRDADGGDGHLADEDQQPPVDVGGPGDRQTGHRADDADAAW